ncbi:MAG: Smr/MutS family protein [Spirochaetales bacterium]|nr:Smr/MutS family protein [Spirochaetales bacterium]MCF7938144.1 Smr/MutS family protein [Spirochaetales bacterium]
MNDFAAHYDRYLPDDKTLKEKDSDDSVRKERAFSPQNFKRMRPQAILDLHGYTSEEATRAVENFLVESRKRGLVKVFIIHGKGSHAEDVHGEGGVLRKLVRRLLEQHPTAGAFGHPPAREGGSGVVWVRIR